MAGVVEQLDLFGRSKLIKDRRSGTSNSIYSNQYGHMISISQKNGRFTYSIDGKPTNIFSDSEPEARELAHSGLSCRYKIGEAVIPIYKTKGGRFVPHYPEDGATICTPQKTLINAMNAAFNAMKPRIPDSEDPWDDLGPQWRSKRR